MSPKIYYYTKAEFLKAFWGDIHKSCKQRKIRSAKTQHEELVQKFNRRYGNSK